MPPVLRAWPGGTARIPATLLDDIHWTLDMDTAAPRAEVLARVAATDRRYDWSEPYVHDWLDPYEVNAVQRLRGWHRLRHGTLTVSADHLAAVRNVLDQILLATEAECEEYGAEGLECCNQCRWCRILLLRDRIDVAMDAQGLYGGGSYEAYASRDLSYDPDRVWADTLSLAA